MAKPTISELDDRFHYHAPSKHGIDTHHTLSARFADLALHVTSVMPEGRELSLALTKLEEAKFWASAGVARNPETR